MSVPNFIVKNLKKCFSLLTIQPDLVKEYGDVVKKWDLKIFNLMSFIVL